MTSRVPLILLVLLTSGPIGCEDNAASGPTGDEPEVSVRPVDTGGEDSGQRGDRAHAEDDHLGDSSANDTVVSHDPPPLDAATTDTAIDGRPDHLPGDELACGDDALAFSWVQSGDLSLHTACRGSGPTILFLHGFPEFWYGWKAVIGTMSDDYRLIAPDQRGYNLSDKPEGIEAYEIEYLVNDIVAFLEATSDGPVVLVGHDWGGVVAWVFASWHPEWLRGLVILNGPHPDVFLREYEENPAQRQASEYIPWLVGPGSEAMLAANEYSLLSSLIFTDAFTEQDRAAYLEAWSQPDALERMINWYRANLADPADSAMPSGVTVDVPTLVLWGMEDTALLPGNIVGLDEWVSDLEIQEFPDATHWIAHEQPEDVASAIGAFAAGLP